MKDPTLKGFTLIELVVVVGIISVITGFGVAGYNRFNDKKKVEQAAKELVSNLRFLQSNAISGIKNFRGVSCAAGLTLDGWYADIDKNEYYLKCSNGNVIPASGSRPKLAEGANISSSPGSVKFNPIYGDTDYDGDLEIKVEITGNPNTEIVRVSKNGNISID